MVKTRSNKPISKTHPWLLGIVGKHFYILQKLLSNGKHIPYIVFIITAKLLVKKDSWLILFHICGQEEVEIEAKVVGHRGRLSSVVVEIRRKSNGELIALGRQWMSAATIIPSHLSKIWYQISHHYHFYLFPAHFNLIEREFVLILPKKGLCNL